MLTSSVIAARLRGAMIGALSGAAAVAAHGIGGGMVPHQDALMLLVAVCALLGCVGSGPVGGRLPVVVVQLGLGQMLGHTVLSVTSGHHPMAPTAGMLGSHLLFAVGAGLAVWSAERLVRSALGTVRRWLVLLVAVADPGGVATSAVCEPITAGARRPLSSSGLGNRGPPVLRAAA
ncbi:hypothetical protein ACWIGI_41285 [Nocardia sp. NPDC055321]